MSLANPGWRRAWSDSLPVTAIAWMLDQGRWTGADRVQSAESRLPRSLHLPPCGGMPEQPLQGARAAFPTGQPDRRMRDARGPSSTTPACAALVSPPGRPAAAPAQLAVITVRPCAAGLSEVQAADAGRARLAGNSARALALTAPGVDASGLSECRQRLRTGHAARRLVATLLPLVRDPGRRNAQGRQRPDSTQVLAAIHTLKRRAGGGETLRQALHVLATAAPAWLRAWGPAVWGARDRQRCAADRLPPEKPARYALAAHMGTAGRP
jgi:transposase